MTTPAAAPAAPYPVVSATVPITYAARSGGAIATNSATITFTRNPANAATLAFNEASVPTDREQLSGVVSDGLWTPFTQYSLVLFWGTKEGTPQSQVVVWGRSSGDWGSVATDSGATRSFIFDPSATASPPESGQETTSAPTTGGNRTLSSTAPVPTRSTNSTLNVNTKSDGLSAGAAAGLAIGCLVAGVLIAGLLFWFFCGRSRKGRLARDSEASSIALIRNEKDPSAKAVSPGSGSPISAETGLPQPLEDKAITGEISKISNLIKNHVQSFYHNGRVSPGLLDLDDLQALGSDLPISNGTLSTLLGNSDTREIALRFCIAWVLVSRMRLSSNSRVTFLPPEVTACFQSMPGDHGSRAQATYLAKWRIFTAELMQSTYGRSAFTVTDPRTRNIEQAADVLDGILRSYADSRVDNNQRRRNLEEILKRAATFAFTLFSQPSSFDFDWQVDGGVQSGNLCIFPALVQISDEAGEPVKPPRPFSEAVSRRLDG